LSVPSGSGERNRASSFNEICAGQKR
jgi:hypothetical protein